MSQPDNSPNYITCSCQHCNGHIKFDANHLRSGESRRVECPHCHLETIIFNKPSYSNDASPAGSSKTISIEKFKSSKIELFLFELTRFPTVVGAILVLVAFIIATILIVQTKLPEKPQKPPVISYEMVAPIQNITPNTPINERAFIPQGSKMAKKSFPQPVVDFLLKHDGFSLKEWLNQLTPDQRQPFLDNLAVVLVTANSKGLTDDRAKQMVKDFSELWISLVKDGAVAREKEAFQKQVRFSQLITMAFGLFISLMTLSLILVLLAIERNTRSNEKPKESQ